MLSGPKTCAFLSSALAALLLLSACGDDDSSSSDTPTATSSAAAGSPTSTSDPLVPPLEGPARLPYIGDTKDFREDPDYRPPSPDEVPAPEDTTDPILNPSQVECPDDWQKLSRPTEGFDICYPADWSVLTNAYKNAPNEARWYAAGIFDFQDSSQEHQLAHVSAYVIPKFARPFPYTKDCPTPYSVTLAGQPAVVCPSFPPASSAEARIISYHVYREQLDYFFNIALYYKWDSSNGAYTGETDQDALDTAIKIVDTVKFTEVQGGASPAATTPAAGSPSP